MKRTKYILIITLILGIGSLFLYFGFIKNLKNKKRVKTNINQNIKIKEKTKEKIVDKKKEYEKLKKIFTEEKKYEGKKDDKLPPKLEYKLSDSLINMEEGKYPKLLLNIEDISGIYRVRLWFLYNGKEIGYMQQNPNSKSTKIQLKFRFDNKVILDNLKSFYDFEGTELEVKLEIWDNNMNKSEKILEEKIKIIDNISPQKPNAYWDYYYNIENSDEIVYSKQIKNGFMIKKIEDLPLLKENKIKKYQISIENAENNKLLYRAGMANWKENKKKLFVTIDAEGKFIFKIKAYDLNDNFSEKVIKFGIDRTPPVGQLILPDGEKYTVGSNIKVKIEANDNLSGIFRYKISNEKDTLKYKSWISYEDSFEYKTASKEGIYTIWCQLEDNAFNETKPFYVNYYAKKKEFEIKSKSGNRERVMEVEKERYGNKIKIKSFKEK
ncbi:hypothetical protein [Haliovirga abyssi]|uniref:Ig-like domain-containing protein n=1 Tax=Haliovirga abyssi TaxID=2996794 RepID=A0AAU9E3U9_9FUSO|nr:hypothetical protein [Haliovirga abyssi]BDU51150.1 hypothetical protein HLVA_17190 [Haliovirga abyssi]